MADVPDGVRKRRTGRGCRRFEPAYCERRATAHAACQAQTPPQKMSEDGCRAVHESGMRRVGGRHPWVVGESVQ